LARPVGAQRLGDRQLSLLGAAHLRRPLRRLARQRGGGRAGAGQQSTGGVVDGDRHRVRLAVVGQWFGQDERLRAGELLVRDSREHLARLALQPEHGAFPFHPGEDDPERYAERDGGHSGHRQGRGEDAAPQRPVTPAPGTHAPIVGARAQRLLNVDLTSNSL
jgi:hypothetical protein